MSRKKLLQRVCTARRRNFIFMTCLMMVCLFQIVFDGPVRNYVTPKMFFTYLSDKEKTLLLHTFDLFKQQLEMAGVEYFICAGTLIGSYRHHGFIPWDDDIDVYISLSNKIQAMDQLVNIPGYILDSTHVRWKFYPTGGLNIKSRGITWKFPFLDISFYLQNETHIWDADTKIYPDCVFRIHDVFPLIERPFEGRFVPAPYNTLAVLRHDYDKLYTCKIARYNHRTESFRWFYWASWSMPCSALASRFPFVSRVPNPKGGCSEYLTFNNTVVNSLWMKYDKC